MTRRSAADASTAGVARRPGAAGPRVVPALTLASHPRADRAGERALLAALAGGREASLSRNEPDFSARGAALGTPLDDPFLSRRPIRLGPLEGGGLRLEGGERGTELSADGAPVRGSIDLDAAALARGVTLELAGRIVLVLHLAEAGAEAAGDDLGMRGRSAGLARVREQIVQSADLGVPVLVRGETGTGKELVARAIHDRSARREAGFVSVNLGAIPRELAAAELFGAKKGAFTGADRDREGFFRAARGGTLFLDEVGEAPAEVQVMLLRVLETGEMYPVGSHTPVRTDVRLVAATDADLESQIRAGRFRGPLLHRLAGYEIHLPPLRARREDIGLLFFHFAREELAALGEAGRLAPAADPHAEPWLPGPVAARLVRHPWPGNIRQLRNVARRLAIGGRGLAQVRLDAALERELGEAEPAAASTPRPPARSAAPRRKPSEIDGDELIAALRAAAWDFKAAADRLGVPRPSIYDMIEREPRIRTAGQVSADEITRCHRECDGDVDAMAARLEVSRRALARRIKEMGFHPRSP